MIQIDPDPFNKDHPSGALIIDIQSPVAPLRNPLKGDTSETYQGLLEYKIRAQQPHVIDQLDQIAWHHMDGGIVVLKCTCAKPATCHGNQIRDLILDTINEN